MPVPLNAFVPSTTGFSPPSASATVQFSLPTSPQSSTYISQTSSVGLSNAFQPLPFSQMTQQTNFTQPMPAAEIRSNNVVYQQNYFPSQPVNYIPSLVSSVKLPLPTHTTPSTSVWNPTIQQYPAQPPPFTERSTLATSISHSSIVPTFAQNASGHITNRGSSASFWNPATEQGHPPPPWEPSGGRPGPAAGTAAGAGERFTVNLRRDVALQRYFVLESKAGVGASVARDPAGHFVVTDLRPEGSAYRSQQAPPRRGLMRCSSALFPTTRTLDMCPVWARVCLSGHERR